MPVFVCSQFVDAFVNVYIFIIVVTSSEHVW